MRVRVHLAPGLPRVHDDYGEAVGDTIRCETRWVEAVPAQTTEKEVLLGPGELLIVRWPADCNMAMWGPSQLDCYGNYWEQLAAFAAEELVTLKFRGREEKKKRQKTSQSDHTTYIFKGPHGSVLRWYEVIRNEAKRLRGTRKGLPQMHQVFVQHVILGEKSEKQRDENDPWVKCKLNRTRGVPCELLENFAAYSEDEGIDITGANPTAVARQLDPGPEIPETPGGLRRCPSAKVISDYPAPLGGIMEHRLDLLIAKATKAFEVLWRDLHEWHLCVFA